MRAQDIADRFGISLRTVYRDVRSLEEAGVLPARDNFLTFQSPAWGYSHPHFHPFI